MKEMRTLKSVKTFLFLVFALFFAAACSDFDEEPTADLGKEPTPRSLFRNYDEALSLAEGSIALVDGAATRSGRTRRIAGRGQCVTAPATRSGASQTDTLMYVFNFDDGDGFSVIAANRAVDPLLAVVEQGTYTYGVKTGAENFDFYMDALVQGLSQLNPPRVDTMRTTPIFKVVNYDEHSSCDPLVPVEWGQKSVFGAYCINGIAGCVATAIAQIMSYYRSPTSFTTTYINAPHAGETISLDWDAIIFSPYRYSVSALLREIGQRVGMDYSSSTSSGAGPELIPSCFSTFGCACPNGFTWFQTGVVRNLLDKKRPVFVAGDNANPKKGGHTWVADGYIYSKVGTEHYEERLIDDGIRKYYQYVLVSSDVKTNDLIHFNWGWNGLFNGYFGLIRSVTVGGSTYVNMIMLDIWSKRNM